MPFRYPNSIKELLPWSRNEEEDYSSKKNCPFGINAELVVTLACYGFHRHQDKFSEDREIKFLSKDPIKFSTFVKAELDFEIRVLGLRHSQDPSIADDEVRLCILLEHYCDLGARDLYERCVRWAPADEVFVTIAREIIKELGETRKKTPLSSKKAGTTTGSEMPLPPTI